MFPGKTCFPLSADSFQTYKSLSDQLNVIFDVIGTPDVAGLEGKYPNAYQPPPPPPPCISSGGPLPYTDLWIFDAEFCFIYLIVMSRRHG